MPSSSPEFVSSTDVDSTSRENRVFPPPAEFSAKANVKSIEQYEAMYRESIADPEAFWNRVAGELD